MTTLQLSPSAAVSSRRLAPSASLSLSTASLYLENTVAFLPAGFSSPTRTARARIIVSNASAPCSWARSPGGSASAHTVCDHARRIASRLASMSTALSSAGSWSIWSRRTTTANCDQSSTSGSNACATAGCLPSCCVSTGTQPSTRTWKTRMPHPVPLGQRQKRDARISPLMSIWRAGIDAGKSVAYSRKPSVSRNLEKIS
mmetsp:Transcript_23052/g.61799  ORF Transcript_23052/g.61799 Transcript_23052/m.61799 type:complete len:201 (-) Transcript_23052:23-625(-)